jgi:ATP-dependent Clp protease protease subunit
MKATQRKRQTLSLVQSQPLGETMGVQMKSNGKSAEIWLYDAIGGGGFSEGVTADRFRRDLTALGQVSRINLRINSPGGDVFDGLAIYNMLAQHPANIVVDIDGLAASIASIIAMAGSEIRMASNAFFMIHNPHGVAFGDASEMDRVSSLLRQVKNSLTDTYARRTGADANRISEWMDDETWFSASEAVQFGFVDSVTDEQKIAAHAGWLDRFRHVPQQIAAVARRDAAMADMARVRLQRAAAVIAAQGSADNADHRQRALA